MPFVEFMQHCLYHPQEGYYTTHRQRVGAQTKSDFITNLSVRSLFAPAVVEAVANLLPCKDLSRYTFCEIGAEPDSSLLDGIDHPFAEIRVIRQRDGLTTLPEGDYVLFANEWLDALPFVRLIQRDGTWQEIFVTINPDTGQLAYVERPPATEDAITLSTTLAGPYPDGYQVDLSLQAERRLQPFLASVRKGLFLTFDYGSTWEAITSALPQGTGRAYRKHQVSRDLLGYPGEQDLTCNVCWDRISEVLAKNGFTPGPIYRQEAFFMKFSSSFLREVMEKKGPEAIREKARIMQLIHPAHMGAAFQVLTGVR